MVTTGGEFTEELWLLYTRGGGARFGVMALGLVPELPTVAALCLEPSSVGAKLVFIIYCCK